MKKVILVFLAVALLVTSMLVANAGSATKTVVTTEVNDRAVVKTTTGQRLIVRSEASFSGKKIGYLNCGTAVTVLEKSGKFTKVSAKYNGKTIVGYVWAKDLSIAGTTSVRKFVTVDEPAAPTTEVPQPIETTFVPQPFQTTLVPQPSAAPF